jgi:hypothetical protein
MRMSHNEEEFTIQGQCTVEVAVYPESIWMVVDLRQSKLEAT